MDHAAIPLGSLYLELLRTGWCSYSCVAFVETGSAAFTNLDCCSLVCLGAYRGWFTRTSDVRSFGCDERSHGTCSFTTERIIKIRRHLCRLTHRDQALAPRVFSLCRDECSAAE